MGYLGPHTDLWGEGQSLLFSNWLDTALQGLFAAANIFSSLKLVYIFSVNPYLGPLQVKHISEYQNCSDQNWQSLTKTKTEKAFRLGQTSHNDCQHTTPPPPTYPPIVRETRDVKGSRFYNWHIYNLMTSNDSMCYFTSWVQDMT